MDAGFEEFVIEDFQEVSSNSIFIKI